ncbi:uncharacterized protein LOC126744219 [Anthonomus grandis grandis]|uniref:uncharacterized protein LOC126744219 n=1 Tax=Anthonomus grandis grandis TaxID=2921223 RepID=UPI0021668B55|nr:uncharacterized protein LOC126744219 [Anthonomus grandis grandis]
MPLANPFAKPDLYGSRTLHREIGYYVSRLEQYENSLKFFDEAIRKFPDDKRALIGRAKSRSKLIQYREALDDVNQALTYDPDDLVILSDKALNTYLCAEFEEGLVQNTRLIPKRTKPEVFTLGKMQCTDAIENCLGERAGRPLRDHFKIIRKLAWKKNFLAHKPYEPTPARKPKKPKKFMLTKLIEIEAQTHNKQPVQAAKSSCAIQQLADDNEIRNSLHSVVPDEERAPPFRHSFPYEPLQKYTTNIENYMAEKYLDVMYLDKIFLQNLQKEPGAHSPNANGSKRIQQLAKNCHKTVSFKQELLRTRKPFYFIKYQEAKVSGALKQRQIIEQQHQQEVTKKEANNYVGRMIEAFDRLDMRTFLNVIDKFQKFCDVKSKKLLPDKADYQQMIYEKVCDMYYSSYRISQDRPEYVQRNAIFTILGLPLSREPSSDSIIDQLKVFVFDHQKKISDLSERLTKATTPEEICWNYYELSRYELEEKHYDLSRVYGKKCIKEAKSIRNHKWIFNSCMLLLKANLAEHNKNDAKNDLEVANGCAQQLQDNDKLEFLDCCAKAIEEFEFEDVFGMKQLEKREQKIIQMMASSKMKDEVSHLFRQMAAMPASRRMTVMPGVRVSEKNSPKLTERTRNMSIMPSSAGESSRTSEALRYGATLKEIIGFDD